MLEKKIFYVIFFLVICIFLYSLFYKEKNANRFDFFPTKKNEIQDKNFIYLHLYVFFQSNNCPPCLETIRELNNIPKQFKVFGVIPDIELENKEIVERIRNQLSFKYDLLRNSGFRKYWPNYTPTIFGCTEEGKILFIFPCTPESKQYLKTFLNSFYKKSYYLLMGELMTN